MTPLLELALTNALLGTGLAVLVALLARAVRRPAVVHVLWVLVLLKFVAAPLLEVPVGFELALDRTEPSREARVHAARSRAAAETGEAARSEPAPAGGTPRREIPAGSGESRIAPHVTPERAVVAQRGPGTDRAQSARATSGGAVSEKPDPLALPEPADAGETGLAAASKITETGEAEESAAWTVFSVSPTRVIAIVWLTGTGVVFLLQAFAVWRCSRWLRHGGLAAEELQREARDIARKLGMEHCPRVWIVSGWLPPMLYAVGPFARVVVPSPLLRRVDSSARQLLLAHELAHYQRGDHWVRLLEMVVCALFWWHPVVWWARYEIREAEEVCCDALVVDRVSHAPRDYAEALLDTIDVLSGPLGNAPVASGIGSKKSVRRRLTAIMRREASPVLGTRFAWAIAAFAVLVLPAVPSAFDARHAEVEAALASIAGTHDSGPDAASPVPDAASPTRGPAIGPLAEQPPLAPEPIVWAVATSPDGKRTLSARTDGRLEYRDVRSAAVVDLSAHGITGATFLPTSRAFVTSHRDGRLQLWDADSGRPAVSVTAHLAAVRSLDVSPDGRRLVSGSAEGAVAAWRIERGDDGWTILADGPPRSYDRMVNCVRFSPDGASILVGLGDWRASDTGALVLQPADGSGATTSLDDFGTAVGAIWYETGSGRAFVAEWNGRVTVVDLATAEARLHGRASKDAVAAASFSSQTPRPEFQPGGFDVPGGGPAPQQRSAVPAGGLEAFEFPRQ